MTKKEQILKLRDEGKSYREIQKIVGCSRGTIAYHCGAEQKIKTLKRTNESRSKTKQWVTEYKTENPVCADCKESYPYWMLDFDHLKNKKFEIGKARSKYSLEEIKEEAKKCELVCANCHRNRTFYRSLKSGKNIDKDKIHDTWVA